MSVTNSLSGQQPAAQHLLPLLRNALHAKTMDLAAWDDTLRLARQARVLGVLAHRLKADQDLWAQLPPVVLGHLHAAIHYARYRAQLVRMELAVAEACLPVAAQVVLLKGAAYLMQGLPAALGRSPNDVDLMVARSRLDEVEAALTAAGWETQSVDAYDQRYYREWSHELPPMRKPGHALELDLHHTIAPVTSRTRADDALLFAGLVELPGSRFCVLHPCDQVIHAAIHLFQDSELDGRLRELVDIDGLIRAHLVTPEDWQTLHERAGSHHAGRVLWYALYFAREWLATPVPDSLLADEPPRLQQYAMRWVFSRTSLPRLPDQRLPVSVRVAGLIAQIRYHRLRMPATLMLRHLWHKTVKGLLAGRSASN